MLKTTEASSDSCAGVAARRVAGAGAASEASALGSTQSYCFTSASSNGDRESVVPVDAVERRRVRWSARAMLWHASSLKAVRCCGRMLHNDAIGDPDDGQGVVIRRREVDGRMVASYQNLMTCGSVWACPRCSAVVAHDRAAEIGGAIRECYRQGGRVYLLTLTMRHTSRQRLTELWDALSSGWRSAFGSRGWTGQRARTSNRRGNVVSIGAVMGDGERFGVLGLTRVVEATYGSPAVGGHGWHLHIHALVYSASTMGSGLVNDVDVVLGSSVDRDWLGRNVFAAQVHSRWSKGLAKAGCLVPGSVAVDVREVDDCGAEYIGRYLAKSTYDVATKLGAEVAAGAVTKSGRTERNRTPFEVLADLAASVDARGFGVRTPQHWSVVAAGEGDWAVIDTDTGEVMTVTPPGEWRIWHEWERASKGRRQIVWSRWRRDPDTRKKIAGDPWNAILGARGETAEKTNEEVAAERVGGEEVCEISRQDWYGVVVWRPELIAELLEVAETEGAEGVRQVLGGCGVTLVDRAPPGRLAAA